MISSPVHDPTFSLDVGDPCDFTPGVYGPKSGGVGEGDGDGGVGCSVVGTIGAIGAIGQGRARRRWGRRGGGDRSRR